MGSRTDKNKRLFYELRKYPNGSEEYKKLVCKIFLFNDRLTTFIGKNYFGRKFAVNDEIISAGREGLLQAIYHFNVDKKFSFSAYAGRYIEGYIKNFLKREDKHGNTLSLETCSEDNEEGSEDTILRTLIDDKAPSEEEILTNMEKRNLLYNLVASLPPTWMRVIKLKYLSGDKITDDQVVKKLGYNTRQNVQQLEKRIIKKLQENLEVGERIIRDLPWLKPQLKSIIETKLSPRYAQVFLKGYYSPEPVEFADVVKEVGIAGTPSGVRRYGISNIEQYYNEGNNRYNLNSQAIGMILNFRPEVVQELEC